MKIYFCRKEVRRGCVKMDNHDGPCEMQASRQIDALTRRCLELERSLDAARNECDEAVASANRYRKRKDEAYAERNRLVSALSKFFRSTLQKTSIEGWDPEWGWCVYIDTAAGQLSWHIHDSQLDLFRHLPVEDGEPLWDGHTTELKYDRLAKLSRIAGVEEG